MDAEEKMREHTALLKQWNKENRSAEHKIGYSILHNAASQQTPEQRVVRIPVHVNMSVVLHALQWLIGHYVLP